MSQSQYGRPLIVTNKEVIALERVAVNTGGVYDEAYIQDLAFRHPDCLPIDEIDRSYEDLIPVCKELNTPAGPLDILYVTPRGRLVIVEAKLWRNPEARRKVIGQILDYAKELSSWDYEDLQREISKVTQKKGNVLFNLVSQQHPDIQEADFVDEVSRTLANGRFLLLVLGDGIREGAAAIASFIEDAGYTEFTFGMVELALFHTPEKNLLVQPRVLAKTVIIKRLAISSNQSEVTEVKDIEQSAVANRIKDDELSQSQLFYMKFWPEWLGELYLDDQSQPFPKSKTSSIGNMFFPMPPSAGQAWITVFFSQGDNETGVFLTFTRGEFANQAYEYLLSDKENIEKELGYSPLWKSDGEKHRIIHSRQSSDLLSPDRRGEIKEFLSAALNDFVNAFRPRLEKLANQ